MKRHCDMTGQLDTASFAELGIRALNCGQDPPPILPIPDK